MASATVCGVHCRLRTAAILDTSPSLRGAAPPYNTLPKRHTSPSLCVAVSATAKGCAFSWRVAAVIRLPVVAVLGADTPAWRRFGARRSALGFGRRLAVPDRADGFRAAKETAAAPHAPPRHDRSRRVNFCRIRSL